MVLIPFACCKNMKATFGAGCFWHVEHLFQKTPGVKSTRVGYAGGKTKNPSYEDVCSDTTGHAEAVEVIFDPGKISYEQLLEVFWQNHDPTTPNRQGPDVGKQYRSAIFYHDDIQKDLALKSKQELESTGKYKKIVTEIVPAAEFYEAEEFHQKYFEKHGW